MGRVIEGAVRTQATLLPESTDDYVGEDHPVRVVDAFVDALDLAALGMLASSPKPKVITLTSAWGGLALW
jgi:transposase